MLAEVDRDGSGEVEYPEFVEIMTTSLERKEAEREQAIVRSATSLNPKPLNHKP